MLSKYICCLFLICIATPSMALIGDFNIDEMLLKDFIVWRAIFSITGNRGRLPAGRPLYCDPVCDVNADCYVVSSSPTNVCKCKAGYVGDGISCRAPSQTLPTVATPAPTINQQALVCQRCSPNADCVVLSGGGYQCTCRVGFTGDGLRCVARANEEVAPTPTTASSCATPCGENALCVRDFFGNYICVCAFGFEGDGINCKPTAATTCAPACDANAACGRNSEGVDICTCNEGYTGDGLQCKEIIAEVALVCATPCAPTATCELSKDGDAECQCMDMYYGDGEFCVARSDGCTDVCHPQALCLRSTLGDSQCVCMIGYNGDGINSCAAAPSACDPQCGSGAECNEGICECRRGYVGNGFNCILLSSITDTIPPPSECIPVCDDNAECLKQDDRYVCRCKAGYTGDGFACTLARVRIRPNPVVVEAVVPTPAPRLPQSDPNSPCKRCPRGGACRFTNTGYRCVCQPPFVGGESYCHNPLANRCREPCNDDKVCSLWLGSFRCRPMNFI